ncbi:MAG: helix-turn-helix domain-containing protein [Planctomycetota bacterium]
MPTNEETNAIAVDAKRLAKMLGVSLRHIRRMDSVGKLPRAVRIGAAKRYLRGEIEAWLHAGAPDRATWERTKSNGRASHAA